MRTDILFSIDYQGNGHVISISNKYFIQSELIISADMTENGIDIDNLTPGVYTGILCFNKGRGWLNGDIFESEYIDIEDVKKQPTRGITIPF